MRPRSRMRRRSDRLHDRLGESGGRSGESRWLRLLKVILCGAVIGVPWLYPPIAVLKLVGLVAWFRIAAAPQRRSIRVFCEGLLIGFVSLGIAFHWARESISETTHLTGLLSVAVWCGLVFWEAIPFGLLSLVIHRTAGRWTMMAIPFVWGLFEIYWPRIFPWSIAHVFLEWLPLVQTAQLGGQAFVTAVVLWLVTGITLLWLRADAAKLSSGGPQREAETRRQSTASVDRLRPGSLAAVALVTVLPVVIAVGYGGWLLRSTRVADGQAPEIRVAALQVDPSYMGAIEELGQLSDELPKTVDLVCWPESTLGYFSDELRSFADTAEVLQLAKPPCDAADPWPGIHCDLLAGAKTYRPETKDSHYRNVAYLINDQKAILDRYIKRDLLPIGEYVPGEQWFPVLREWAALDDVLDRGESPVALKLTSGPTVGVMICYEDMVARNAIDSVRSGAEVLVALINASQFSSPYTLLQHERLARLRAVENQRWVLRCGATGRTCLIAPSGKMMDSVPLETSGVLLGNMKVRQGLTPYARYPHWFAGLCWIVAAGLVVVQRRAAERVGPDSRGPEQ